MALIRALQSVGGGSSESEFYINPTSYGGAVFETAQIANIKTKAVKTTSSPDYNIPRLVGFNTYNDQQSLYDQRSNYTTLKSYTSVDADYVDDTSLIQNYTYFGFTSGNSSNFSNLSIKITWA